MAIDLEKLGQVIQSLRIAAGLSQSDIAASLDISKGYVSLMENGKRPIRIEWLNQLEEVLKVPAETVAFLSSSAARHVEVADTIQANMHQMVTMALRLEAED